MMPLIPNVPRALTASLGSRRCWKALLRPGGIISVVGMLFQEFPMVPLGQRMAPTLHWPPCAPGGHLLEGPLCCFGLPGSPFSPHSPGRTVGKGEPEALGPAQSYSLFSSCPMAQSEAALRGQNSCSAGGQGGASQVSVPVWGGEGAGPLQTRPSSSDPCGLLDAVKADTGWGGGDGHGAGHPGADRVLVLPSVPPLPDGRADLWA